MGLVVGQVVLLSWVGNGCDVSGHGLGRGMFGQLRLAASLERGGLDDSHQEGGGTSVRILDTFCNLIHSVHIVILETTSEGIDEHLFGQAMVKVVSAFI